jgi:hypothetical protein
MRRNRSEDEMNKQKRGLLITIIQRKFEDNVYEHLSKTDFSDIESLDLWLDNVLTEYLDECETIEDYYNNR